MDVSNSIDLDAVSGDPIPSIFCTHCDVYPGQTHDGRSVALKAVILFKSLGEKEISRRKERMSKLLEIWARCNHPNVVKLIGQAAFRGDLAAVYGWHEYGSIRQYLKRYPTADPYQLSVQICDGVVHLHANGIIHGELNGDQILVSGDGVARIQLSVETSTTILDAVRGKGWTQWTAPEIATGCKYTLASDIFSLGMTILEIITEGFPYGLTYEPLAESADAPSPLLSSMAISFRSSTTTRSAGWAWSGSAPLKNSRAEFPPRPTHILRNSNDAGDAIWYILCKSWSYSPEKRPAASDICTVMQSVYQTSGGVAFRGPRLVVTENTSIKDLVAHYEQRGLMNYTDLLPPISTLVATQVSDTSLANVYKADLSNKQHVAVKCVKHINPYKKHKRAARELSCWSTYQHENILPMLGFAVLRGDLAMISQWMNNGCITDYVVIHPDCDRLSLCVQLTGAIMYLHKNNVVHGDVKGPNVLISDRGTVQVTDFGVSIADHQEIEFSSTSSGRGTNRWQAPEILLGPSDNSEDGNSHRDGDSSKEGDVYAFGMTMAEIYTGARPYGPMEWSGRMFQNIVSGRLRPSRPILIPIDSAGNGLWVLMQECWVGSPGERPTASKIYARLRDLSEAVGSGLVNVYARAIPGMHIY